MESYVRTLHGEVHTVSAASCAFFIYLFVIHVLAERPLVLNLFTLQQHKTILFYMYE